ncbi:aldo/keto reductase [Mycobacterium sp. GA-2829]|uniref:aldo/keto reductase n=1 Tax=Mycobacterium sp. GA-2829 TaxID=1772283 RepID=UPI0007404DB6|nr:aldo/keto reductase [Mycobacterium sp. GA-2829]KUI29289.1 alcohol dehydrogenase [Mycobacterium sp. GA-2829]
MKTVRLGASGLELSAVTLGMMTYGDPQRGYPSWTLGVDDARPFIRRAYEAGITTFDTANAYSDGSSEEILGTLTAELAPREEFQIATKVFGRMRQGRNGGGLSRVAILHEIDASLRRLGTDYVDLYQLHGFDATVPIEETMEALHDVVRAGKARYIGASNLMAWQLALMQRAAERNGWTKFVSLQQQYNLMVRDLESEIAPLCAATGLGILPWSPLARGRLARPWQASGSGERASNDPMATMLYDRDEAAYRQVVQTLQEVADGRGEPMSRVALAWLSSKSIVASPIVGATKEHHIDDAVAATDLELSDEEISTLESANSLVRSGMFPQSAAGK